MSAAVTLVLPRRRQGQLTTTALIAHGVEVKDFCAFILETRSRLDFTPQLRGWCYILENAGCITKADFDRAEQFITDRRKDGGLPLDITAVDEARTFNNEPYPWSIRSTDSEDIASRAAEEVSWVLDADNLFEQLGSAHEGYEPLGFWEAQPNFILMLVEKQDLVSVFEPVCREFHVAIANAKGWSDIHVRAEAMRRFKEAEARGRQPVLTYCGDLDPAGRWIIDRLRSNFAELKDAVGWSPDNLIIDHFGLHFDFIDRLGLPWVDNLITASGKDLGSDRHPDHFKPWVQDYIRQYGKRKLEANALVTRLEEGRDLCRQTLLAHIDLKAERTRQDKNARAQHQLRDAIAERVPDAVAELVRRLTSENGVTP